MGKAKKPKAKCCAKFRKKGRMCSRCPLKMRKSATTSVESLKKKKDKEKDKKKGKKKDKKK